MLAGAYRGGFQGFQEIPFGNALPKGRSSLKKLSSVFAVLSAWVWLSLCLKVQDRYTCHMHTLIEQSYTLIEQSYTLIKQSYFISF